MFEVLSFIAVVTGALATARLKIQDLENDGINCRAVKCTDACKLFNPPIASVFRITYVASRGVNYRQQYLRFYVS